MLNLDIFLVFLTKVGVCTRMQQMIEQMKKNGGLFVARDYLMIEISSFSTNF
jgi:hypothetical protein